MHLTRLRLPARRIQGVRYVSRLRAPSRPDPATLRNRTPREHRPAQDASSQRIEGEPPRPPSISDTLRDTNPTENSLLAPVHIPEDPDAVLKSTHPATSILQNSGLVVQRQLEMMNVFLGFEQANRYVIMDATGNHVGYMAETDGGIGKAMARQTFRTHRAFTTHIFDRSQREVLRFNRPFSWINSRIRVYDPLEINPSTINSISGSLTTTSPGSLVTGTDPSNAHISPLALSDMRVIGEAQQQWAPLRRKYNLFLFHTPPEEQTTFSHTTSESLELSRSQSPQAANQEGGGQYTQFAMVDEPFLSWDFSLLSADKQLIGSVNRNFAGFARELFTDTGMYALRMDSAGLAEEAEKKHIVSQTGSTNAIHQDVPGMTLDQRAVMLATAVSIDFDYFSRHSGSGTGGWMFMPMWMGGGEAGAGAAGAEAAGGAGAADGAGAVVGGEAGALGRAAGSASGAGEGAMAGAGTMAGYEMLQRGREGEVDGQGAQDPALGQPNPQEPPQGQQSGEDVWGQTDDPWNQGPGGSGSQGGESGGGGGDGGDGSWLDEFF